jgi:Protein of unknown function (DUF3592)
MSNPPGLRSALAAVIAELGGMGRIGAALRRFAVLPALAFAAAITLAAGYELYRVDQVSRWEQVPARIVSATWERSTSRSSNRGSWRYRMVDPHSGEELVTGDLRPGDFPVTIGIWSTADADAARFQARAGETILVRRSPDRTEVYPEAGDNRLMTGLLAACGLFWAWLLWQRRTRAHLIDLNVQAPR